MPRLEVRRQDRLPAGVEDREYTDRDGIGIAVRDQPAFAAGGRHPPCQGGDVTDEFAAASDAVCPGRDNIVPCTVGGQQPGERDDGGRHHLSPPAAACKACRRLTIRRTRNSPAKRNPISE